MSSMMSRCVVRIWPRSRSYFNVKQSMTVFRVCTISFEPLVGFIKNYAQMYDESMCIVYVWPRSVQGQGHSSRLKTLNDFISSPLYYIFWTPGGLLQITLHKCQVWWADVQCICLTMVVISSKSYFKVKHCMTVFCVRSISFEALVVFTNNSAQLLSIMNWCAVHMFDQSLFKIKVIGQVKHCMTVLRFHFITHGDFLKWLGSNIKYHETMWRETFNQGHFKVKVKHTIMSTISFEITAQMSSNMSRCAVCMFYQGRVKVIVQG